MDGIHVEIDATTVDPASVRFIYRSEELPGTRHYLLSIVKRRVDEEMLLFADLSPVEQPLEKQVRNWVYWLGNIVSRFCDPDACEGDCWVFNDVQSISETESRFLIRGRCSPWISKP